MDALDKITAPAEKKKREPKYEDKRLRIYYNGEEVVPSPVFATGNAGRLLQMCYRPSSKTMEWMEVPPATHVKIRQEGAGYSVEIDVT